MTAQDKFKVISLFSGGMGLDLGLESTGRFEVLACVEKEPPFCETIRLNRDAGNLHPNLKVFEGDINEINPHDVLAATGLQPGELDLLVGGPPCQSFSTAGRRGATQDPRGTLIWQFLRFVDAIKPKFFLMENVRGVISAALRHRPIAQRPPRGPELEYDEEAGSVVRLFSEDVQAIEGARYHMDIFEVNSVNYGAPQIRERALFVGNSFGLQMDFPEPTHVSPSELEQQPTLFGNEEKLQSWATLRDAIGDLCESEPEVMDFSPRKKSFLSAVPPGSNWRSLSENVQRESMGRAWFAKGGRSGWWRRLTFDLPCPTLMTMPNHASTSLCHPSKTRALTVREYARIQEFPDDWVFSGKVSDKYAQIGNAVPARLGRVAGDVIAGALDDLAKQNWTPSTVAPEAYRIIYVRSHIRTRHWFKDGKTIVWSGKSDETAEYGVAKTRRKYRAVSSA